MTVHSPIVKQTTWHSEADTAAFAKTLVQTHDLSNCIIELRGDLGAGKTTLTRYLLQALGVGGRIKSPTYAIVETYLAHPPKRDSDLSELVGTFPISHFDFYRFNDPAEWEEAGFRDIFAARGLKIVEWAEKARPMLPAPDWLIAITLNTDESRTVNLSQFESTRS